MAMSALFPVASLPHSGRPRISAPPRVANSRASLELIASAPCETLCINIAWRASKTRFPESLLADPSTPKPILTPASSICRIGAIPEPSLQFEHGQCDMPV